MGKTSNDFVVETKGHCFLCLNKIYPPSTSLNGNQPASVSVYSVQCLSHYLEMDMRKVFVGCGPVQPQLLRKLRESKLKVELCQDCVYLNNGFLEQYRQLEKAQMKVASWINIIRCKMEKPGEGKLKTELQFLDEGKLQVVEALRDDAKQKCLRKLKSSRPRIQNLTVEHIERIEAKNKFNKNLAKHPTPTSNHGITDVKDEMEEDPTPSPPPNVDANENGGDWDDYFGDSDHSATKNQEEEETIPPKLTEKPGGSLAIREKCVIDTETSVHKCKECSREFTSYPAFYLHYKSEHLKIQYNCSACRKTFKQIGNYNRHQKVQHSGVKFKCQLCNQVFGLESSLQYKKGLYICSRTNLFEMYYYLTHSI